MKDLAGTMTPNSSALFVLVRKSTPDKVLEEVKGTGGTILKTSLSHEDEAKLQAALRRTEGITRCFKEPRQACRGWADAYARAVPSKACTSSTTRVGLLMGGLPP